MADQRWTDDRLDEVIDAEARRMTEGALPAALASRVAARRERPRPLFTPVWQLASAALIVFVALFAIGRLWPEPVSHRAAAPVAPESRPAPPLPPSTTVASNTAPKATELSRPPRRRPAQTIVIERRADDLPALDAPPALTVDAAPVAELRVAPLNVEQLSVTPLEVEPDRKPR
jgi:hypothetical protein